MSARLEPVCRSEKNWRISHSEKHQKNEKCSDKQKKLGRISPWSFPPLIASKDWKR